MFNFWIGCCHVCSLVPPISFKFMFNQSWTLATPHSSTKTCSLLIRIVSETSTHLFGKKKANLNSIELSKTIASLTSIIRQPEWRFT